MQKHNMSLQQVTDTQFSQIEQTLKVAQSNQRPVQSSRLLVLQKLTQTQRNLMLIKAVESPGAEQIQDIVTLLHAGAQINYQKRSAPHWTALNIALSSNNIPLIELLLEEGAVMENQLIQPKKGTQEPAAIDLSKNAWNFFWHKIISEYSFEDYLHFKNFAKQNQNTPWGAGLFQSTPKPEDVLKSYLDSNSWTYALECQKHFESNHATSLTECFNKWLDADPGLTWRISGRHGQMEQSKPFFPLLEHNLASCTQQGINILYDTAIVSDQDRLLGQLLLARRAPTNWRQSPPKKNSSSYYYGEQITTQPLPLLMFAYQQSSEKCIKMCEQLPFLIEFACEETLPPKFFARLPIEKLKHLETLGVNLNTCDEKSNTWLHYYMENTSEATVGLESLARWKISELQTTNAEGKTPLDILTGRIRSKARPFYYMSNPEDTLLQIERIISKVEASVLRKEIPTTSAAKKLAKGRKRL